MKLIACASKNWGIGKNNDLLFHLPKDMKFFRETTAKSVVIMGRKTLESFPGQKPLPGRINIVLSKNSAFSKEGTIAAKTPEEAFRKAKEYPDREAFIIGGGVIYELMLPYCDTALITRVMEDADADTFIHDFASDTEWELYSQSDEIDDNGHILRFCEYRRK